MAVVKEKNLKFLGEEYQQQLIGAFFFDREFFKDLQEIVDPNMFTDIHLRTIVNLMKEHYARENAAPSYTAIRILINNYAHDEIEQDMLQSTLKVIEDAELESIDWVKTRALRFFKQQHIIKTANEILRIAGNGDDEKYEQCVDLLTQALHKGVHDDMGSGVFDDMGETLSDDYRAPIPTGIEKIDKILEGGLGKGELGVIIGSSSFGKTSLTTSMASYASTCKEGNDGKGFKVLQIVFEDTIKQIQRKHIAKVVSLEALKRGEEPIEAKDLSKPDKVGDVRRLLDRFEDREMMSKNLRIIRLPSGEYTAAKIKNLVLKLRNNGFMPDLMIVDYFECLAHAAEQGVQNEWEREGKTMRKFEAMAHELNMAIWIPLQGTKDSLQSDVVTMDKAGGSFKKIQIAHIVMSIARTMDDIEHNKATLAILKNRAGKSGEIFKNADFNNGTCIVSTSDDDDDAFSTFDYMEKEKPRSALTIACDARKSFRNS